MLLEDRFYLMPVLPDSYEFSKAQIDSLGTMILEYTDANNNYFGVSLSLNKDKVSYKTTETFVKLDGKEVQMAIICPSLGLAFILGRRRRIRVMSIFQKRACRRGEHS